MPRQVDRTYVYIGWKLEELAGRSTMVLHRKRSRTSAQNRLFREAIRVGDVSLRCSAASRCGGMESERQNGKERNRECASPHKRRQPLSLSLSLPLCRQFFALVLLVLTCKDERAAAREGGVCEMRGYRNAVDAEGAAAAARMWSTSQRWRPRRKDAARTRGRSRMEGSRCWGWLRRGKRLA